MLSFKRFFRPEPSRRKRSYRPGLEPLEARLTPSIAVTNLNDAGPGSLRAAITAANAAPGNTIVFDAGVTGNIDLFANLPDLSASMTIQGPGANLLTVERSSSATTNFGILQVDAGATVTISGLTVANGTATGILNDGHLTLQQLAVHDNHFSGTGTPGETGVTSNGSAGGILNDLNGTLSISQCTIANNSTINSLLAAGIDSESGSITVTNSTISGNVANNTNSTGGIGIYGGTATITSCTISGNTAIGSNTSGGGMDAFGTTVTIYNTIVAGNTGASGNPSDVSGTFTSQGNNLIGSAESHSSGFVPSDKAGTVASPINAKLGALANYGGTTPTLALLAGSPAIDAGNNTNAPATDQRGVTRPQGPTVDIGAFELSNPTKLVVTSAPSSTIINSPFGLTVTAEDSNGNVATGFNGAVTVAITGGTAAGTPLYVSEAGTNNVVQVAPDGTKSIFASGFNFAGGLAFDSSGNLYVSNYQGTNTVSKVTPSGTVTTFATGFNNPFGLAMDSSNNLYVANVDGNTVSKVTPGGTVTPFASGFSAPTGLAVDSFGNLYVTNNAANTVSKVAGGIVTTFASGFNGPEGLAFDGSGNLYVANIGSNTVSKVTPGGVVSTFAAGFDHPVGLAFDSNGNLYVVSNAQAGTGAGSVSKVSPSGTVSNFSAGFSDPFFDIFPQSTLSGTTTVTAVNGVAAFSGLAISPAGIYTLTLSSNGLASATTAITVTNPPLTVPPGGTLNLATSNNQPTTLLVAAATFQANSTLQVVLTPSASSQLVVTNDVNIDPTANLVVNVPAAIPIGQVIKIIKAGGAVNGEFAGLPEGAIVVASNGQPFQIHYVHDRVLDGAVILTAVLLDTTTVVTASPSLVQAGQPVTFTATVDTSIAVSSQALQITGAVSYSIDGGPPQPGTVTAQGGKLVTTLNTSALSPGTHQVIAAYTPDANAFFNASTSSPLSITVVGGGPGVWTPLPPHVYVTAADAGGQPKVKVFDASSGAAIDDFFAYPAGFSAGVRVAAADLQGAGTPDLIVVPGPGGGSIIQVFDGRTGQMRLQFAAFANGDNLFTGGSYVAAGDILGQGYDDIIVSADAGGGPAVAVFDGKTGQQVMFFFAFPNGPGGAVFTGGVRVAAGPYVPGGPAAIYTAAGPGGGPAVSVWSAADIAANQPEKTFYVLPPDANGNLFTGGVYLGAVAAGDGRDYLVTGAAPGGGPAVTLIDPLNTPSASAFGVLVSQPFYALDPNFAGGVRVAGGTGAILTAAGPGGGPVAQSFSLSGTPLTTLDASDPDNPDFFGGLYVAAT